MLDLQGRGALNINFVSPTHVILPILRALRIAWGRGGISIPLVYNSNGYDSPEVVSRLEGIVDIYLPDLKYASSALSLRYSGAADYFEKASAAVREMSVQQPVLELDAGGIARKGLILRHLVLPGHADDSVEVLRWIRGNLSPHIGLSLMSQYRPCFKAPEELQGPCRPRNIGGWPTRPSNSDSRTFSSSRSLSPPGNTGSPISTGKTPSTGDELRFQVSDRLPANLKAVPEAQGKFDGV